VTARHLPRLRHRHAWGAGCLALLASLGLVVFSTETAWAGPPTVIPTPLATSLQSGAGTWATLPMGHLHQPLNTFWQLFFQPTGATTWTDKVGATATATNGGLVLATAPGQPFIAAVRPAHLLHFSPLIYTADGGHSWDDGLLSQGLAASPDALSTAPGGQTLALVDHGLGAQVLVSQGNLSTWQTLITARQLASGSGNSTCGLRSLSAVAFLSGHAIVGGNCSRSGAVGIFAEDAGSWRLQPLGLSGSFRHDRVQLLALAGTPDGLSALLGIVEKTGTALVAAWTTSSSGGWSVSSTLTLAPRQHLVSFGPTNGMGLFVLSATSSDATRLAVVDGPGGHWNEMPPPPATTATVAFAPSTTDALTVHGKTMTVWSLPPGSATWQEGQHLRVALTFGSSS